MKLKDLENDLKGLTVKRPDESFRIAVIGAGKRAWDGERELFSTSVYTIFTTLSYACALILIILIANFAFLQKPVSRSEDLGMGEFYRVMSFYLTLGKNQAEVFESGGFGKPLQTERIQSEETTPLNNKGEKKKDGADHSYKTDKKLRVFC